MSRHSSFAHSLLLTLLFSITFVTATPRLLPRYPYRKQSTGTAPYPTTGTGYYPTGTSYPTYHPTGSVSSTTQTPSSTAPPTATPTSFKIAIQVIGGYPTPPLIDGYAVLIPGGPDDNGAQVLSYTDDISLADTFTLNADGTLQTADLLSAMPAGAVYHDLLFQPAAAIASGGYALTHCAIDAGGFLACVTATGPYAYEQNSVAFTCAAQAPWTPVYGPTGRPYNEGCYTLMLRVVGV